MTPEQERARKLADKVKYRIGMIEGGYAEGGIPLTTPELKVLLEDYRNSLDREEQLIQELNHADAIAENWRREVFKKYPTPYAYNAAYAALHRHRERADAEEAKVGQLITENAKLRENMMQQWVEWGNVTKSYTERIAEQDKEIQRLEGIQKLWKEINPTVYQMFELISSLYQSYLLDSKQSGVTDPVNIEQWFENLSQFKANSSNQS